MMKRLLVMCLSLCLILGLLPVGALAAGEDGDTGAVEKIETKEQLMNLLNDGGTLTGTYELAGDFTIDTNQLRKGAARSGSGYTFNGTLDGKEHIITVKAEDPGNSDPLAPLFDTLRGSVSNLNVVFEGDVKGTTIAYDILGENGVPANVSGLSVHVKGNILPIDLDGEQNAAGFAYTSMGGNISDVSLTVERNIGDERTGDMGLGAVVSSGFIYYVGANSDENILPEMLSIQNITVEVKGNIQSYSANGSAYAFGFGYSSDNNWNIGNLHVQNISHYSVSANAILAETQAVNQSANAYGMIQSANSNITNCTITAGTIHAKGVNRSAYASGFIFNNSGRPTGTYPRLSVKDNRVFVGSILAENIGAPDPAISLSYNRVNATGFAIQLMGSIKQNETSPLEYSGNEVHITEDISARSTSGYTTACGFVTTAAPDDQGRYETLRDNHVEVGGDISAESTVSHAFAAGFSNVHKAMAEDCSVTVDGDISATAASTDGMVAKASGFTGVLTMFNEQTKLVGNSTLVKGSVQISGGNGNGSKISGSDPLSHYAHNAVGGLLADFYPYASNLSRENAILITGNQAEIGEGVALNQCQGETYSGLLIGYNFYQEYSGGGRYKPELRNNTYTGPEQLLALGGADLYCAFTGRETEDSLGTCDWYTGNTVAFTRADGTQYTADVSLVVDLTDAYQALWKLTNIQEILKQHTITATAGTGGTITPSGAVTVNEGDSQSFTITAATGYHISDVLVDGVSKGAIGSYTFTNVTTSHTIRASFAKDDSGTVDPTPNEYTLRYETNGGKKIESETYKKAWVKAYEDLPVPVRPGYVFEGWYRNSTLTMPVTGDVKVNTGMVTLFAKWSGDGETPSYDTGVSKWLNTTDHMAYLNGYTDGTFRPEKNMTRAEAAQMFYNLLLDQDISATVSFADVPADMWCADAVNALAYLGVIEGVGDNRFAPEKAITRAEFTVIAMRFANVPTAGTDIFTDVDADDWFYEQVVGAVEYGWINGYSDGTFRPNSPITRAEVTTIVNRMLERQADEEYVDKHTAELRQFADVTTENWAYYQIAEATNAHHYKKDGTTENWTGLK